MKIALSALRACRISDRHRKQGNRMKEYHFIKKEFSFLESQYGFHKDMKQRSGSYCYLAWINDVKKVMVLYDCTVDTSVESAVWIRIYDADSLGTAYDDVDEFRNEFAISSKSTKEKIHAAAEWLKNAIENGTVQIRG